MLEAVNLFTASLCSESDHKAPVRSKCDASEERASLTIILLGRLSEVIRKGWALSEIYDNLIVIHNNS